MAVGVTTGDHERQDASHKTSRDVSPPNAARGRRRRVLPLLVATVAIAGIGWLVYSTVGARTLSSSNKVPELTHAIMRRDLRVTVTEQGTLESSKNTEVRCKVKGANNTIVWIIENGTEVAPDDVLVRIDTSTIETNISTQEIAYQNALATFAQSKSDVAVAEINITEYIEGTYRSELKTKEKDVAIAEANLRSAQNMLNHAKEMYRKGFISKLELEGNEYSLQQAELELEVKRTDTDVLTRYTKVKQVQDLEGILAAKKAKLASDEAALKLEEAKLERERRQLENCVIRAPRAGMVIYGGGEKWEDRPDIREGATVREDQVLLLIPDLTDMQVKVGVHEALIDQVKPGLSARVDLQERIYDGEVLSIAPMAERAGWWNGNMVKYETIIKLDAESSLKPGMSATVDITLSEHPDALTIPVAAVLEQEGRFYCWVAEGMELQQRELHLGASDDQFLEVMSGVALGEEVVINPIAFVDEAKAAALKPYSGMSSSTVSKVDDESSNSQQKAESKSKSAKGKTAGATQKSKPEK